MIASRNVYETIEDNCRESIAKGATNEHMA